MIGYEVKTVSEAASYYKVTPDTIHRWRKDGRIKDAPFIGQRVLVYVPSDQPVDQPVDQPEPEANILHDAQAVAEITEYIRQADRVPVLEARITELEASITELEAENSKLVSFRDRAEALRNEVAETMADIADYQNRIAALQASNYDKDADIIKLTNILDKYEQAEEDKYNKLMNDARMSEGMLQAIAKKRAQDKKAYSQCRYSGL